MNSQPDKLTRLGTEEAERHLADVMKHTGTYNQLRNDLRKRGVNEADLERHIEQRLEDEASYIVMTLMAKDICLGTFDKPQWAQKVSDDLMRADFEQNLKINSENTPEA